jgi:hypothetical protein
MTLMKKLLVTLAALLFTSPAFAGLDHWTCSNETTVLFMVLNTDEGSFHLWDDKGLFLASAKFTEKSQTKDGIPFLAAELDNGTMVGVAKSGNTLILAIASDAKTQATRFTCQ